MKKFEASNQLTGNVIDNELSALALHEGICINADLSLGVAFKLDCDYTSTSSGSQLAGQHAAMRAAMNVLPAHYDIQVIWRQHHRTTELDAVFAKNPVSDGIVGEIQQEERDLFRQNLTEGRLRFIEVYFVLVRKCTLPRKERFRRSRELRRSEGIGNRITHGLQNIWEMLTNHTLVQQYEEEEYMLAAKELLTFADKFQSTFEEQGWSPTRLNDDGMVQLFYAKWNRGRFDAGINPPRYDPSRNVPLSEYYINSPLTWNEKADPARDIPAGAIEVDGHYHSILSLHTPSKLLKFPFFGDLLLHGGAHNTEVTVTVRRGNRSKRISTLQRNLKMRKGMPDDPVERQQLVELDRELQELGSNREHVWEASVHFDVWDANPERLKRTVLNMIQKMSESECTLVEEKHAAWRYFRDTNPCWTQGTDRFRMLQYSTKQIACLLPLCGHPTNLTEEKPIGVLYETACGTLFNWVLPDEKLFTNPHHFCVGGTGAGKSMLEDQKLIALRLQGAKSIIIDLGKSFENFCKASGGKIIEFRLDSTENRVNPFDLAAGVEPSPEIIRQKSLWLEFLVRDVQTGLSTEDKELIEEAVQATYARHYGKKTVFLRDVRATLIGLAKSRSNVLAGRLQSWCSDVGGSKGNLFDGPTTVNWNAPVIVFDLKHIARDNRDLELGRILFNSIMTTVAGLTMTRTKEPKSLTFDEAGELVKDPTNAKFLDYAYRTLRKNGVIVNAMTQDIDDFVENPELGNMVVGSVENRILMKQNNPSTTVPRLAEVVGLNAAEQAIISSLKTGPGRFSEFLLQQVTSRKRRSFRLTSASTPLRYAFTCNSNSDNVAIEQIMRERSIDRIEAIRIFAKRYPLGVENTPKPQAA